MEHAVGLDGVRAEGAEGDEGAASDLLRAAHRSARARWEPRTPAPAPARACGAWFELMVRLYWRAAPAALPRFVAIVSGVWHHGSSGTPGGAGDALHRRALAALPVSSKPRVSFFSFMYR